jgi:hypothetical protein
MISAAVSFEAQRTALGMCAAQACKDAHGVEFLTRTYLREAVEEVSPLDAMAALAAALLHVAVDAASGDPRVFRALSEMQVDGS